MSTGTAFNRESLLYPSPNSSMQGILSFSAVTLLSGLCGQSDATTFVSSLHRRFGKVGTVWANDEAKSFNKGFCPFSTAQAFLPSGTWTRNRVLPTGIQQMSSTEYSELKESGENIRIAIVGGGLAGITAASAIASRIRTTDDSKRNNMKINITVFEGDGFANHPFQQNGQPPPWKAATARNANSIVPGSSMHIMSQRSVLADIFRDTVKEWTMLRYESFVRAVRPLFPTLFASSDESVLNIDNFNTSPPYFAVHILRCLGHHASWEERLTFVSFLTQFLKASVLTGPKEANGRAEIMVQLAKANREALLKSITSMELQKQDLGIGEGFLGLHRTLRKAEHGVKEVLDFDEQAELLTWEKAIETEPHLKNLPLEYYVVHRNNELVVNCLTYTQKLKERCRLNLGVEFREDQEGIVLNVERVDGGIPKMLSSNTKSVSIATAEGLLNNSSTRQSARFRITTGDGEAHDADYVVLAAGVDTPLFARKLNVVVPTYPLRGYSLTLYADQESRSEKSPSRATKHTSNLLNRSFSLDNMYCTSVSPTMARIAGFGELVGYKECGKDVPSVGPRVLARYGRTLFPEASNIKADTAIQCFRPLSPDDIPIAGGVSSVPGLYVHNGHGTLGWTTSLATAECVAQAFTDDLAGKKEVETFDLPNGKTVLRKKLSPDRFAS